MATYGEIRFQIARTFPGLDATVLDALIQQRYQEIIDQLPWSRMVSEATYNLQAPYATGLMTLTDGSTIVSGTGNWTNFGTRALRITGKETFYAFTASGPTGGEILPAWSGTSGPAAYTLYDYRVVLPELARHIKAVRFLSHAAPLMRTSKERLDELVPTRQDIGLPCYWFTGLDDHNRLTVDLYPLPTEAVTIGVEYVAEQMVSSTAMTLLPFVRPAALIAGVLADLYRRMERPNLQLATVEEDRFRKLVGDMVMVESQRLGARLLKVDEGYTKHERRRGYR